MEDLQADGRGRTGVWMRARLPNSTSQREGGLSTYVMHTIAEGQKLELSFLLLGSVTTLLTPVESFSHRHHRTLSSKDHPLCHSMSPILSRDSSPSERILLGLSPTAAPTIAFTQLHRVAAVPRRTHAIHFPGDIQRVTG